MMYYSLKKSTACILEHCRVLKGENSMQGYIRDAESRQELYSRCRVDIIVQYTKALYSSGD